MEEVKYLSRYVICSKCDQARAEYTWRSPTGKPKAYLCETCAEQLIEDVKELKIFRNYLTNGGRCGIMDV